MKNMLCDICGKRPGTVMVTQMDASGQPKMKRLCLSCAAKLGMPGIDDMLKQMGVSPEEVDAAAEEIANGDLDGLNLGEMLGELSGEESDDTEDSDGENEDNGKNASDDEESNAETSKSSTGTPKMSDFMNSISKLFGGILSPRDIKDMEVKITSKKPLENNEKQVSNEKTKGKKDEKISSIKKYKFLSQYGIDMNMKALNGKIDNVVGRDRETERVIQILNRRQKNNPALIGEPGVGKTAIAEGLALRIVKKEVPFKLQNKTVVMLDLTAIVAGTQFRGQFESRMKGLIDDVRKHGNVILVIDEIHNIIGAGEAEGSLNAANILKPALSRGEIQVIGTTTIKEYRKYIEKDGALERRFQPVMVEEPSIADTIEIIKGIREHYGEFHSVRISDEIAEAAVRLSERYISDRFLPDKAIDVLDEAASRANLRNPAPQKIFELNQELAKLNNELSELETQQRESANVPKKVQPDVITDESSENTENDIIQEEDPSIEFFKLIADKKSEIARTEENIKQAEENKYIDVEYSDIAKVIEIWTGIPVNMISEEEAKRLMLLDSRLKEKVIGQDKAVSAVSKAIRRNRSGFGNRFRPSSFIFAGPTGVGKTELVKQLTIEMFGNLDSLIRLDMSEYMEKHTVAKLIGSPPGYVGYDEAGQLTEKVRRHPYSVVLFDEIEKAHPDVFNMLLQILDDGRLTDSQGRVVNFENTIIIMTTNAYGKQNGLSLGFGSAQNNEKDAQIMAENALKKVFKPEFLNRIDEIVVFSSLERGSLLKIVRLMLKENVSQCERKNIKLEVTDRAVEFIADRGYEEEYGARPLRRFIQKNVEDVLAEYYLSNALEGVKEIIIDLSENKDELNFDLIK